MRAARAAHPTDFHLAFTLGGWFTAHGTDGREIGLYEGARALRSSSFAVFTNLGKARVGGRADDPFDRAATRPRTVFVDTAMPSSAKSSPIASDTSGSSWWIRVGGRSMTVTQLPRRRKACASSSPTSPPPRTIGCSGTRSQSSASTCVSGSASRSPGVPSVGNLSRPSRPAPVARCAVIATGPPAGSRRRIGWANRPLGRPTHTTPPAAVLSQAGRGGRSASLRGPRPDGRGGTG